METERLDRWDKRQDAELAALHHILDRLDAIQAGQKELLDWLQRPSDGRLQETLVNLTDVVAKLVATVGRIDQKLDRLDEFIRHGGQ